jgi:chromosome segregation ATPase
MKPESKKQIERLHDACDLLRAALDQHAGAVRYLKSALDAAEQALSAHPDAEATRLIADVRAHITGLPTADRDDAIASIAEILAVLATEVTAHEEHLPAGAS